jgi:hypothetical protein
MPTILSPLVTGRRLTRRGLHDLRDLLNRGGLGDGYRLRRHDLTDVAAMFALEVEGDPVGAGQKCQQAAALSLGPDLGATKEVAFGQDTDQIADLINNRQSAYAVFELCLNRID